MASKLEDAFGKAGLEGWGAKATLVLILLGLGATVYSTMQPDDPNAAKVTEVIEILNAEE